MVHKTIKKDITIRGEELFLPTSPEELEELEDEETEEV